MILNVCSVRGMGYAEPGSGVRAGIFGAGVQARHPHHKGSKIKRKEGERE